MAADEDFFMSILFLPWLQEGGESLHDEIMVRMALFMYRCISDSISTVWGSVIPTVGFSVIASGIYVIFFLVRIQLHKLNSFVCPFHKYGFSI